MRGSVAFRPLFFSSSAWVMGGRRAGRRAGAQPIESFHHTSLPRAERPRGAASRRHDFAFPCVRLPRAPLAPALAGALGRLPVAADVRQLARRHHALPDRDRAGQRHHQEQVGAGQARHDAGPGARRARLAAARRPVPRRPLGLRLHDPPPGRRAAAAPRRRPFKGDIAEEHRERRRPAGRARVRRLDRHLQDRAQRAAARADRRAAQGAAGAAAAAAAPSRRRRRRRAATRRSSRSS